MPPAQRWASQVALAAWGLVLVACNKSGSEATGVATQAETVAEATQALPAAPPVSPATPNPTQAVPDPPASSGSAGADLAGPGGDSAKATAQAPIPSARKTAISWTSGAKQTDPAFAVWLEAPKSVTVGTSSPARVRLKANAPFKCNDKYPAKFSWENSAGVSVPAQTVKGLQISDKDGTIPVSFQAKTPGPVTLSGTFSFSVCTETNCRVEKRRLQLTTQALPPS